MIDARNSRELNIPEEEIQEPLVRSYRETLIDKKVQLAARKWNGVLYTTSLLLVLSVCVLGVNTVNNVEKMQNLETTVNEIAGQVGQAGIMTNDAADTPAMSTNTKKPDENTDNSNDSSQANKSTEKNKDVDKNKDIDENSEKNTEENNGTDVDGDALTEAQTYLLQGYYIVQKGDSMVGISKKYMARQKSKKNM